LILRSLKALFPESFSKIPAFSGDKRWSVNFVCLSSFFNLVPEASPEVQAGNLLVLGRSSVGAICLGQARVSSERDVHSVAAMTPLLQEPEGQRQLSHGLTSSIKHIGYRS